MSYKIYIETDESFKVECCEFETFIEAKVQVEKMIVDLIANQKDFDFGFWDEFKEEFSVEILSIIESFEKTGAAPAMNEDFEGDTNNYHYCVSDDRFTIVDSDEAEYAPAYSLQTNMLGMNQGKGDYYFRLWKGSSGIDEVIIIRLEEI